MCMKKILFLLVFIGVFSSAEGQPKSSHDSIRYWMIQPSVGYTTFALGDVKDFYDEVLSLYREQYGLDIPTQKKYPGNVLLGIHVLYNVPSVVRVGLGTQITWTEAYSGYEDYAGLFEVESKIQLITSELVVERDIETLASGKLFVGVSGGLSFVTSDYSNSISLNDYPDEEGEVQLNGDGTGFIVQPYVGWYRNVGNITLGLHAGYRFAKVKELDGEMVIPGEGTYSGKIELEHDLSGIVVNAAIGFKIKQ